jgi:hypothetical protein
MWKLQNIQRGAGRTSWWIVGVLVVLALIIIIPLARRNTNNPQVQGVNTSVNQQIDQDERTIGDILDNPDNYVSKQITLTGSVSKVLDPNAFNLKAPGIDRRLLVVTSNSLLSPQANGNNDYIYKDDDIVQVNGTIQKFDTATIGNQLGISFNDDQLNDYIGKPVVVAQSVTKLNNE